jgi:hypothetical protein
MTASQKNIRTLLGTILLCGAFVAMAPIAYAQTDGALTLTITPPLFQLNLVPGESWTSGIRVVNSNPYDMTVYADPVLFEPEGDTGRPSFIDVTTEGGAVDTSTLAGWITVPRGAHVISREQTYLLPIAITVPEDAAPGGHYAAVLIGNRPPTDGREEGAVSVTSSIAALIFLRVAGDVVEDGRIRDFVTERSLYEEAEARLSLRFENQGNVHLQPQGDITIYNMFGKKRGYIPINQAGGYGNVLPNSMRKFTFMWTSDSGMWDIGRYRAEVTLGYGVEVKSFAQATTYFWVLPLMPLAQVLGGLVALMWFVGWALRAYVRRALALETRGMDHSPEPLETTPQETLSESSPITSPHVDATRDEQPTLRLGTLIRPIEKGMVDLRRAHIVVSPEPVMSQKQDMYGEQETSLHIGAFMRQYRAFFIFLLLVVVGVFAVAAFVADVTTSERSYSAIEERSDGSHIELPITTP